MSAQDWYDELKRRMTKEGRFVLTNETMTPERATLLLEMNIENRNVSQGTVAKYQSLMRTGKWVLNGESVKIDDTGLLIDGQHRLWASVMGEVSFPTMLDVGLPRFTREVIDQGLKRTPGHVLAMRGIKDSNTISAAVRVLLSFDTPNAVTRKTQSRTTPALEIVAALTTRYGELPELITPAARAYKPLRCPSKSQLIALMFLMRRVTNEKTLDAFWGPVASGLGVTGESDPRYRLRTYLLNISTGRGKPSEYVLLGMVIKAWNFWRDNRSIKLLAFKDTEDFPRVK